MSSGTDSNDMDAHDILESSNMDLHLSQQQANTVSPPANHHQLHHQSHHNHNTAQQQQQDDKFDEVMQQLMILVQRTQNTDTMVQTNRETYQNFVLRCQDRSKLASCVSYARSSPQYASNINLAQYTSELQQVEVKIKQFGLELDRIRHQLVAEHLEIFDCLSKLQGEVMYKYLPMWHHEQQLINNGVEIETIKLDTIQAWVEKIVEIIWRIKNQIKGLQLTLTEKPNLAFDTEQLDRFVLRVNRCLENLILNAFVVEKQPPQVMKTNTRFTAAVRFLCGNKLNVQMINPTVKALILSEGNARTVIRYHKQLIKNSWATFESSVQPFELNHQTQQLENKIVMNSVQNVAPQPINIDQRTLSFQQQQQPPQHQQQLAYNSNLTDGHLIHHQQSNMIMMTNSNSPDQPMSVGDQSVSSPPHQQFFQQQHPPQQYQQHQNQVVHLSTVTNMTPTPIQPQHMHQQFRNYTEIGYNPNAPLNSKDFESSGEILNNSNILEYQETTGHIVSQFKNMQLKKIKRTEKKGTESVMDEKFILLFFTEFRVADDSFWPYSSKTSSIVKRGDLMFHILAFSLPVVVIVHGNQEPHAWATVTWHNAFATRDELLYKVPDKVPWRDLGNVLSEKFRSNTGRGLSAQNLKYLASKVYRTCIDSDDILVSWNQFSKEPLSDKSFTFWEWFHSILKLTKDYLRDLWRDEKICGFVGKKGCVDLLLGSAHSEPAAIGTFLLRFSETELGGITIAWVSNSSEMSSLNVPLNEQVQISQRSSPTNSSPNIVMHLQPMVGTDLKTRGLADRIRDLKDLIYLYPNVPKDEAFQAYYKPINSTRDDMTANYIPSMLVTQLTKHYPSMVKSEPSATTPNSISQNSPEGYYNDTVSMNDMVYSGYPPYDMESASDQ